MTNGRIYEWTYTESTPSILPHAWCKFFREPYVRDTIAKLSRVIESYIPENSRYESCMVWQPMMLVAPEDLRVVFVVPLDDWEERSDVSHQGVLVIPDHIFGSLCAWKPFIIHLLSWIIQNRQNVCFAVRSEKLRDDLKFALGGGGSCHHRIIGSNLLLIPQYLSEKEKRYQEGAINAYFMSLSLPLIVWR